MNPKANPPALAMQYSFTLPADYDMGNVERRIAEKGPALDGLPGLRAKAYLSARRDGAQRENLYAPFYVWDDAAAMNGFLTGRGFAGVSDAFGWPQVRIWIVWRAWLARDVEQARFATSEMAPIAPFSPLDAAESPGEQGGRRRPSNAARSSPSPASSRRTGPASASGCGANRPRAATARRATTSATSRSAVVSQFEI